MDAFRRTLAVNRVGSYIMLSYAARAMAGLEPLGADGERGVIINTSSGA
jgi:NAD(P)-dependent dehydrogenase (short-subunit alcohol dehydrogenase family)